jgi:two-component system, sporulation sensor kinase E
MMVRTRKHLRRLLGPPRPVEFLVRNVLAFGFLVLLLLAVSVGYRSIQSLEQLEKESRRVDESEESHLRIALEVSETAGKIETEARTLVGKGPDGLLGTAARLRLRELKQEMDREIDDGRRSSLVDNEEWQQFETTSAKFWEAMDNAGAGSDAWHRERTNLTAAAGKIRDLTEREREQNNLKARQMGESARNRILTATAAVLIVGLVVAALAFYEIRRNLNRLEGAYAASAESRDYLQSLLDSLVSGVVVIDQDGTVQTVSESFRRLPGADTDSRSGQSYRHLFRNNSWLVGVVSRELSEPVPHTHYNGRIDLGAKQFDVFSSPLIIGGERQGVIVVFVDVSDAALAQSELRRNRALTAVGQMTTQIAHEVKNPLGSIRFAAEVLKRQASFSNADASSTIQVIERSVDHLAAICAQLSEFARPKELNRAETNLNALLDDLLPMVADRLSSKQIQVSRTYQVDVPAGFYDGTELKKLFLNLIINAVEASEPGGAIELRTRHNGGQDVLVEIVDQGIGMDAETQKRLFEPFYTTKEKGTGLGMAIAKQIAELHSGNLSVISKAGAGTTAIVRLPLTKFAGADNRIGAVNRHT